MSSWAKTYLVFKNIRAFSTDVFFCRYLIFKKQKGMLSKTYTEHPLFILQKSYSESGGTVTVITSFPIAA